jgi:hypothetical protein
MTNFEFEKDIDSLPVSVCIQISRIVKDIAEKNNLRYSIMPHEMPLWRIWLKEKNNIEKWIQIGFIDTLKGIKISIIPAYRITFKDGVNAYLCSPKITPKKYIIKRKVFIKNNKILNNKTKAITNGLSKLNDYSAKVKIPSTAPKGKSYSVIAVKI